MKKEYIMKLEKIEDLGWVKLSNEGTFDIYGKMDRRLIYLPENDSIVRIWKDEGFGGESYIIKTGFHNP